MKLLPRLAALLDRAVAALLALLLTLMVLAVTWQVVSRYALNDPSGWTEELARFILIWLGVFGGAMAYHRRLHLGLDLLAGRLSGAAARWHARLIDVAVLVFALAVLVGGGVSLVALTLELEQLSPALGLPMAAVYLCLPASGLIMAVSALAQLTSPGTIAVADGADTAIGGGGA